MNEQILTKQSNNAQLRQYFEGVLRLSNSGNEFPINLDDVWRLVYERKDHAVRALTESDTFIQGVDYQPLPKNGENSNGGQNRIDYYLSTSCLEFFIARKVREVFNVYREVFHAVGKAALNATPEQLENLKKLLNGDFSKPARKPSKQLSSKVVRAHYAAIEEKKRLLNLSDASIAKMINTTDKVLGIEGQLIEYVSSKGVLKPITELLKKYNVNMSAMAANKKLAALGILEQHSRRSLKGFKNFWALTKRGLEYGQNEVNPNNPKETQPLYFEDKFSTLLTNF